MSLSIGDVDVQTEQPAPPAATSAPPRPAPIDPDELRTVLRRRHDRATRLWVD